MSLADEMLTNLANVPSVCTAEFEEEPHIVIGNDRFIRVPEELKKIAVQYDHNVETVTFDCPRYWDGYDMSKMKIYINYTRSDGLIGMYVAQNIMTTRERPNIMHFDWTLTRNVTGIYGPIVFMVCVKRVDNKGHEEIHWNSERNTEMYVAQALRGEEAVRDQYPDVYTQILQRFDEMNDAYDGRVEVMEDLIASEESRFQEREDELELLIGQEETSFQTRREEIESLLQKTEQNVDTRCDEHEQYIDEKEKSILNRSDEIETEMVETQEMIKEVSKIATPEAMQSYVNEYLYENPTDILEEYMKICSIVTDNDIDEIIAGTYDTSEISESLEELWDMATYEDIDAIIKGGINQTDPAPGEGEITGSDITEEDIDGIVDDLFTT